MVRSDHAICTFAGNTAGMMLAPILFLGFALLNAPAAVADTGAASTPSSASMVESAPDAALAHRAELKLSPGQIDQLRGLHSGYLKESMRRGVDIRIAELELSDLQGSDNPNVASIAAKLKQIEALRNDSDLAAAKVDEDTRALLTAGQREKLETIAPGSLTLAAPGAFAPDLNQQIKSALDERLRDEKAVEIETADAVIARVSEWAERLLYWIGLPIALLFSVLGIFGYRELSDVWKVLDAARRDSTEAQTQAAEVLKNAHTRTAELKDAQDRAAALLNESTAIAHQLEDARARLNEVRKLSEQVHTLSSKVKRIEERFKFDTSAESDPDLKTRLEEVLKSFQSYLAGLGNQPKEGEVTVNIKPDLAAERPDMNLPAHQIAFYDPGRRTMYVRSEYADDPDVALRQFAHHVLLGAKPDYMKLGGSLVVIESALATYFPCSFNNNHLYAEKAAITARKVSGGPQNPYFSNLKEHREIVTGNVYVYDAGRDEAWGGAFWELRERFGQPVADKLLLNAWSSVPMPADGNNDLAASSLAFLKCVVEADTSLEGAKHVKAIQAVFRNRGLRLRRAQPPQTNPAQ
jgi:Spy/CpxP family protein refolding chaperone